MGSGTPARRVSTGAVVSCSSLDLGQTARFTCAKKEYSAYTGPIPLDRVRRANKDAFATKGEQELFHSGIGKISWLVHSMHANLAFRLIDRQRRANDVELCVRDLMAYNKLASDAKAEAVGIRFRHINLSQAVILVIGDSSFTKVGRKLT